MTYNFVSTVIKLRQELFNSAPPLKQYLQLGKSFNFYISQDVVDAEMLDE